jgi:ABC-type nitrate/sulfonate/bicarbonate transport system substrate-binding protein
MVTYAGPTNLPVWAAIDEGFFGKEGLDVTQEVTRGSVAETQDLMSGKYQFGATAMDNIIANTEGLADKKIEGFDLIGILGAHSGMNRIFTRPEITSFAGIRGKAIAVDARTAGYGQVLIEILAMNGLKADRDYTILAVGSGPNRLMALKEGRAVAAGLSAPEDTEAKKLGFNILGDTTEINGAYQVAYVVRRAYASTHEAEVLAFIRAMVAATDYVFADKAGALAEMKQHVQGMSDADLEAVYTQMVSGSGGFNRGAKMNMEGVGKVLALRNDLAGSSKRLTDPYKYVDLSYYEKATGQK